MCAAKQGMFTQSCETGSFYFNFSLEETPISQITQFWKEFESQSAGGMHTVVTDNYKAILQIGLTFLQFLCHLYHVFIFKRLEK